MNRSVPKIIGIKILMTPLLPDEPKNNPIASPINKIQHKPFVQGE